MTSYSLKVEQLLAPITRNPEDVTIYSLLTGAAQALATLQVAEELRRIVAAQAPAAPTVVYRATSALFALGHYTTREQARAHCVADADEHDLTDLRWVTDVGMDGDAEQDDLWGIAGSSSEPIDLEYTVKAITAQVAYEPDAEN